jgi:hypothetical protein
MMFTQKRLIFVLWIPQIVICLIQYMTLHRNMPLPSYAAAQFRTSKPTAVESQCVLSFILRNCVPSTCEKNNRIVCSEHSPFAIFELILVIHANTSNGTNHFV